MYRKVLVLFCAAFMMYAPEGRAEANQGGDSYQGSELGTQVAERRRKRRRSRKRVRRRPASARRMWNLKGGLGLAFGPAQLLFNPSFLYRHSSKIQYGPHVSLFLGSGTLFATGIEGRYYFGPKKGRFKIVGEAALGISVNGGLGIYATFGPAVEYIMDRRMRAGTTIRGNFFSSGSSFRVSWLAFLSYLI